MIADRIRPPVKSKKLELEHLCLIDEALDTDNENRIFICTAIQVCFVYKGTCIRAYAYTHAAVSCVFPCVRGYNKINTKIHACNKSACAFRGQHTRGTREERLSCGWFVP